MINFICDNCGRKYVLEEASSSGMYGGRYFKIKDTKDTISSPTQLCPSCEEEGDRAREEKLRQIKKKNNDR